MKFMTCFEGVDTQGRAILQQALRAWHRDTFVFSDGGPWSRYVMSHHYSQPHLLRQIRRLFDMAQQFTIAVHVVRDLDLLVGARETRPELEAKHRLFEEAFRELPPAHLVAVDHAEGLTPAALIERAQEALLPFTGKAPGT